MKRTPKAIIAMLMCVCLMATVCAPACFAMEKKSVSTMTMEEYIASAPRLSTLSSDFKEAFSKVINMLSNWFLNDAFFGLLAALFPNGSNVEENELFDIDNYGDFFSGTGDFVDSAEAGNRWSLGYAKDSILPDDFGTAENKYARGSYIPWWYSMEMYKDEDGVTEDLCVRTVILNDGSGRGSVSFSVIDCIGLANADVRRIRDALEDFAAANNIVSINVSATHTHSGIDSQGVWTSPLSTMLNNYNATSSDDYELENGIDEDFLKSIIEATAASVKAAYADMTQGKLTYAVGDISDYVRDRTPPYSYSTELSRFIFTPDDAAQEPTVIASFGCHPESSSYDYLTTDDGLKTDTKISGDFVWYMEKLMNRAGYNFIYIQGDVGTVTSSRGASGDGLEGLTAHDGAKRYGYELAYITLGMDMTPQQRIDLNSATGDLLGINQYAAQENYTVWYDNVTQVSAQEVEPFLNVAHDQFLIEVQNSVALLLSKSALASIILIYDEAENKYYTVTEIGYIEFGNAVKVFLSPGETYSELLLGGDGIDGFAYNSLRSMYGDNMIIFDLQNDAAGYIAPDNTYVIAGLQYDPEKDSLESDTWCLLVSMGKNTASTLIGKLVDLIDRVSA